ncbi:unnamed protein product, partial [Mesorhabditis belari]|uniref:C2H2-type domain-containing protein n=1 Tax=Mesorhabditis belari TaxID=2138241 RepID=A0AAF3FNY3_9BILA
MDQPVIVNSLLTFLRTFREHPLIERIINDHFAPKQILDARKVIETRLGVQNISHSVKFVDLFDLADNKGILPTFAVADLSELPMVIASQEHRKMELVRKEWEEENSQRSQNEATLSKNLPNDQQNSNLSSDVVTPFCRQNLEVNAASPEAATTTTCSSANSEAASTSPKESPIPSSYEMSMEVGNKKRKMASRSLDAALKRLSDRRITESEPPAKSTSFTPIPTPTLGQPMTSLIPQIAPGLNRTPFLNGMVDAQAYLNMLRLLQQQQQSHLFSGWSQQLNNLRNTVPTPTIKEEPKKEDEDELEKESNDGSPSPSEEMKDDGDSATENNAEKPYVCSQPNCSKRFANKFLLKKHMFIHTGLRPHACPYCTKRFNRKDNLLRHKKTHIQNGTTGMPGAPRRGLRLFMPSGGEISDDISD